MYFMSISLVSSAFMVIVVQNPLHSVLFLALSFLSASVLLLLFSNEFLALFFLIIYLGAILVLFLFMIMMLDVNHQKIQVNFFYFPAGSLIGFLVFLKIQNAFSNVFSKNSHSINSEHNFYLNWYESLDSLLDLDIFGQVLYRHYILQILIVGLILYTAVIGVACLTFRSISHRDVYQKQIVSRQLSRRNIL